MNRRRLVFAGIFFGPLLIVAACSFPDVQFADTADGSPDGVSPTKEGSAGEAGSGDAADQDTGPPPIFDGAAPDVDTTDPTQLDASGCAVMPRCDCDNDGYKADDCDAGTGELDAHLLDGDCDDLNKARNPGAGPHDEPTDNGDWNCDGTITRYPPPGLTSCPSGFETCPGSTGFRVDPGCGQKGEIYTCQAISVALTGCGMPVSNGDRVTETCQ